MRFIATKFEEVFDKKEEIMKFDLKKEKIAVLCDTVEKVAKVCEVLGEKMFKNFRADNQEKCYVGYGLEASGYVDELLYDSYSYFTNKTRGYKLITFEEFMGEKEKNKVKFKVGDKVIHEVFGVGEIFFINYNQDNQEYAVHFDKKIYGHNCTLSNKPYKIVKEKYNSDNNSWWCKEKDLKLVEKVPQQTFEITISDSVTTLETNGKKVEIKRYYTDKHDVEFAMQEVVNKYFDEVRKEEIEAGLPKVGDRVKVIDNRLTYDLFKEWLIENNVSIESAIKWKSGECPKNGGKYTIKMIVGTHILIEDDYNSYIIDLKGLEVVR